MKVKILFVVPELSIGGTISSLTSILNSDFSQKYEVEVFAINKRGIDSSIIQQFEIGLNKFISSYYSDYSTLSFFERLKSLPLKLLKRLPAISKHIEEYVIQRTIRIIERRKRYDFVVAFQEGNATKFTSHFTSPHKIAWIHCDYANSYGISIDELELYERFFRIVCVSNYTRDGFIEKYPPLKRRTITIHNLFDSESVIKKSEETVEDTRFDTSQFTIISLGRISEVKRFYLVPVIASKIKEKALNFRWYILGGCANTADLIRVKKAIKDNKVENEVIYLGGKYNPYPYLKAADLLVTVSQSEACPMIFNEARILNVPVLSSDFGSANEFIHDKTDGVISSIDEMHIIISEMISSPEKMNNIRKPASLDSNREILNKLYILFS